MHLLALVYQIFTKILLDGYYNLGEVVDPAAAGDVYELC